MSEQEKIIEVCGKKVVARYTKDGLPCKKCVFGKSGYLCPHIIDKCGKLDLEKAGDGLAYFVEAEQPINIGTDTWFQQLKVGDKVETYDGRIEIIRKKYEDSFMLGFDAEGRENCAPDGYFPIAISGCRPFVDQPSSIAPKVDLDAEIKWYCKEYYNCEYPLKNCSPVMQHVVEAARHFTEWERKRTLDKVVEWMKKNLTYIHPRKGVETCMVNIPVFLDAMNEENT